MALKDEWKGTGKKLGGAFSELGKNLLRTAKVGADRAEAWADGTDPEQVVPKENVTNDGSWRQTGKELGGAFAELGKTLFHTAEAGAEKAEQWAEEANAAQDAQDKEK
jgi:hypothetical protein